MFALPDFNFDHTSGKYGGRFAVSNPENPELMTAYSRDLIEEFASDAGLSVVAVLPDLWSGQFTDGVQDMVLLERAR